MSLEQYNWNEKVLVELPTITEFVEYSLKNPSSVAKDLEKAINVDITSTVVEVFRLMAIKLCTSKTEIELFGTTYSLTSENRPFFWESDDRTHKYLRASVMHNIITGSAIYMNFHRETSYKFTWDAEALEKDSETLETLSTILINIIGDEFLSRTWDGMKGFSDSMKENIIGFLENDKEILNLVQECLKHSSSDASWNMLLQEQENAD